MAEDFGVKVSQAGKEVVGAGDQDLLFSSSWPNLKIVFNGRIRATTREVVEPGVSSGIVMKHNLKYVPFFIPYKIVKPGDAGSTSSKDEYSIRMDFPISADKDYIYLSASTGGAARVAFDIGLIIFALDIEKNFKAPNIDAGTSSAAGKSDDVGIKFTKEGKDISSNDLRDYLIHSRTRSPMVHEVFNQLPSESGSTSVLKDFVYTHDLPYNPMFFLFGQESNKTLAPNNAYAFITSPFPVVTQGSTIRLRDWSLNKRVSIVVLKDPFIVDDNIQKVVV